MSKKFFVISVPNSHPNGKPIIVGLSSVSEDLGIQQKMLSRRERELIYWGIKRIDECALSSEERTKRLNSLISRFL